MKWFPMLFCYSHRLVPNPVLIGEASPINCSVVIMAKASPERVELLCDVLLLVCHVDCVFSLSSVAAFSLVLFFLFVLCFILWQRVSLCDLKSMTIPQPPRCWHYRQMPPRLFFFCVRRSLHITFLIHKHSDELFIRIVINILMHTNLIYINYYRLRFSYEQIFHSWIFLCLQLQTSRLKEIPLCMCTCLLTGAHLFLLQVSPDRLV